MKKKIATLIVLILFQIKSSELINSQTSEELSHDEIKVVKPNYFDDLDSKDINKSLEKKKNNLKSNEPASTLLNLKYNEIEDETSKSNKGNEIKKIDKNELYDEINNIEKKMDNKILVNDLKETVKKMNIALMSMNIALMMCMLTDCLKDVKKKVSKCRLDSEKSLSLKLDKIDPYESYYNSKYSSLHGSYNFKNLKYLNSIKKDQPSIYSKDGHDLSANNIHKLNARLNSNGKMNHPYKGNKGIKKSSRNQKENRKPQEDTIRERWKELTERRDAGLFNILKNRRRKQNQNKTKTKPKQN